LRAGLTALLSKAVLQLRSLRLGLSLKFFLNVRHGEQKKAEEMLQRALNGYEETLGLDHTSTLNAVNNLGVLYTDRGKLKEAEDVTDRSIAAETVRAPLIE
jgi:hypothetical protein